MSRYTDYAISAHDIVAFVFEIHFIIIMQCMRRPSELFISGSVSCQIPVPISLSVSVRTTCPAHLIVHLIGVIGFEGTYNCVLFLCHPVMYFV